MSEEMIVTHCSPTMAGLKTGSLFSCRFESRQELLRQIRGFNNRLVPRGAAILPLRFHEKKVLIYMYRPSHLKKDLACEQAARLLAEMGYPVGKPLHCLRELMRRLEQNTGFPHEIGLFLGYPPEDVCGFIENRAMCAKCVGDWKVYGDEKAAQCKFAQYRKCRQVYCSCFRRYQSFDRLVVSAL